MQGKHTLGIKFAWFDFNRMSVQNLLNRSMNWIRYQITCVNRVGRPPSPSMSCIKGRKPFNKDS